MNLLNLFQYLSPGFQLVGCHELWQWAGKEAVFLAEAELLAHPQPQDRRLCSCLSPLEDPSPVLLPKSQAGLQDPSAVTWCLPPILGEAIC